MKKYESILKRVDEIEEKYGIKYAGPKSRLFTGLRAGYTIVFIYTLGINLILLLGMLMMRENGNVNKNLTVSVAVCTVLIVAGFVLLQTRFLITGAVLSIIPSFYSIFMFSPFMTDSLGFFGYKPAFYVRHFIPLLLMLILLVLMLVIVVRYRVKKDRAYKRITENLYIEYHSKDDNISDEQWEEFLANYDPRAVRKIKEQN